MLASWKLEHLELLYHQGEVQVVASGGIAKNAKKLGLIQKPAKKNRRQRVNKFHYPCYHHACVPFQTPSDPFAGGDSVRFPCLLRKTCRNSSKPSNGVKAAWAIRLSWRLNLDLLRIRCGCKKKGCQCHRTLDWSFLKTSIPPGL